MNEVLYERLKELLSSNSLRELDALIVSNIIDRTNLGTIEIFLEKNIKRKYYPFFMIYHLGLFKKFDCNFDEAIFLFEELLKSTHVRDKASACLSLGDIYAQLGEIDKAESYYQEVINLNAYFVGKALISLGKLKYLRGSLEEAEKFFKETLKFFSGMSPQANLYLAWINIKKEDYDKAFIFLARAIANIKEKKDASSTAKEEYETNLIITTLYLVKKLGIKLINLPFELKSNDYLFYQIEDFSIRHTERYIEQNRHKKSDPDFTEKFQYPNLINFAQESIKKSVRYNDGLFDSYIIPLPNNGEFKYNYIKVLTIPNTKDIVIIYPAIEMFSIADYKKKQRQI